MNWKARRGKGQMGELYGFIGSRHLAKGTAMVLDKSPIKSMSPIRYMRVPYICLSLSIANCTLTLLSFQGR